MIIVSVVKHLWKTVVLHGYRSQRISRSTMMYRGESLTKSAVTRRRRSHVCGKSHIFFNVICARHWVRRIMVHTRRSGYVNRRRWQVSWYTLTARSIRCNIIFQPHWRARVKLQQHRSIDFSSSPSSHPCYGMVYSFDHIADQVGKICSWWGCSALWWLYLYYILWMDMFPGIVNEIPYVWNILNSN